MSVISGVVYLKESFCPSNILPQKVVDENKLWLESYKQEIRTDDVKEAAIKILKSRTLSVLIGRILNLKEGRSNRHHGLFVKLASFLKGLLIAVSKKILLMELHLVKITQPQNRIC